MLREKRRIPKRDAPFLALERCGRQLLAGFFAGDAAVFLTGVLEGEGLGEAVSERD